MKPNHDVLLESLAKVGAQFRHLDQAYPNLHFAQLRGPSVANPDQLNLLVRTITKSHGQASALERCGPDGRQFFYGDIEGLPRLRSLAGSVFTLGQELGIIQAGDGLLSPPLFRLKDNEAAVEHDLADYILLLGAAGAHPMLKSRDGLADKLVNALVASEVVALEEAWIFDLSFFAAAAEVVTLMLPAPQIKVPGLYLSLPPNFEKGPPLERDRQAPDKFPADHFNTKHGLQPDRLSKARKDGRIKRAEKRGGRWFYDPAELRSLFPDAFGDAY